MIQPIASTTRIITAIALLNVVAGHIARAASGGVLSHHNNAGDNDSSGRQVDESPIHLTSMDDLDHVAYLSLRNYNLTDEYLLESSWLLGVGNALGSHKQHQYNPSSSPADSKSRSALILESFVSHLRNGHLRRLTLDELQSITTTINLNSTTDQRDASDTLTSTKATLGSDGLAKMLVQPTPKQTIQSPPTSQHLFGFVSNVPIDEHVHQAVIDESSIRCKYLVQLYQLELSERFKRGQTNNADTVKSKTVEYENNQNGSSKSLPEAPKSNISTSTDGSVIELDTARLLGLCRLAIGCHSADDLVGLISGSWQGEKASSAMLTSNPQPPPPPPLGREPFELIANKQQQVEPLAGGSSSQEETSTTSSQSKRKSLRDSLSLSLAKLCPLMLFQLHEDDGMCTVRRDDRPTLIHIWGFATLFVTIVSFCSLIGLSLTPLLGQSAATDSTDTSETSSMNGPAKIQRSTKTTFTGNTNHHQQQQQPHKASLMLFEGLAVGSLVGSALFSLIPQAFELQERESNQSFLLKAFIIFSGIYLFFLSERIMRIILDTRQQRKKRKRINHRSSTTAAIEHDHQPHQHQQMLPLNSYDHYTVNSSSARLSSSRGSRPQTSQQLTRLQETSRSMSTRSDIVTSKQTRLGSGSLVPAREVAGGQSAQRKRPKVGQPRQHKHQQQAKETLGGRPSRKSRAYTRSARSKSLRRANQRQFKGSKTKEPKQAPESDCDYPPVAPMSMSLSSASSSSSTSTPSSSSSSSSSSYSSSFVSVSATRPGQTGGKHHNGNHTLMDDEDRGDYSSSSSTCYSNDDETNFGGLQPTESDSDDGHAFQARAVNKQIAEVVRQQHAYNPPSSRHKSDSPMRTTSFRLEAEQERPMRFRPSLAYSTGGGGGGGVVADQQQQQQEQDISTVAWMIILGDGLHNFIDGISIGAAFSESILSGVSISVAVICEEFPHELGDFAVLVSSGMTVRQALGYNFLSACTCYLGMAVGIILGDVTDGASYISALAAGVFLYIALVDMMGELSAALESTSRDSIGKTLKLLLLQNVGIFIGISIIFVLSFIDF